MKLAMVLLKGLEWDEKISDSEQTKWYDILTMFVELNDIKMQRCCIPSDEKSVSNIRLICLSYTVEFAGGAVVYAGQKLKSRDWSCSILASKSKSMDATIPRNELSAILLCTELPFLVKRALGDLVDEIIYCTDSTIALSWCKNMTFKLRLFVYNRVITILRMCEWTTGKTEVTLYHIDGKINLADLLTKQHELSTQAVTLNSEWQTGLPWMRLDTESMLLLAYNQFRVEKLIEDEVKAECYDDAITGEI